MLLGVLSLLLGQFFGNSLVPIGTKIAVPFTGPILFVFLRFLVGTIILFIFSLFTKRKKTVANYKIFALLGFFLGINVFFFTVGIVFTTVIMSTLIYSLTPLFVGIGGHFFLGESFTKQKIAGLLVSFTGLLFLLNQSLTTHQVNSFGEPLGNILLCIGMLGYSTYVILSRKAVHTNNHFPVQITLWTFIFITIYLFFILLFTLLTGKITVHPFPSSSVLAVLLVGASTVLVYIFLQIGIKRINAFTASLFQYTGPFIAAVFAIPLLHEQITIQLCIGGLLILFGVFIATTYNQFKGKFLK